MSNAALPVTQSSLEAFARGYLNALGAAIREEGSRWRVRLPDHVDVAFTEETEFDIALEKRSDDKAAGRLLAPDSDFTQQLLEEAASMSLVGQVIVTEELAEEYRVPEWLTAGTLQVEDASFTPYYDRTAVFTLVRIGVETVSEYQNQFLEGVAIDASSDQILPELAQTVLDTFYEPNTASGGQATQVSSEDSSTSNLDAGTLEDCIRRGQTVAWENIREDVEDIQSSASRAAGSEFNEYRQLQEQRLNDIRDQLDSVTNRLENVATEVDEADSHQQRMELLQKREELQDEKAELQDKQEGILEEKRNGFDEKRREINERHELEVSTTPIASTIVSYERGEVEFQLKDAQSVTTHQVPYAAGIGVTDDVRCDLCQTQLSAENPAVLIGGELGCSACE